MDPIFTALIWASKVSPMVPLWYFTPQINSIISTSGKSPCWGPSLLPWLHLLWSALYSPCYHLPRTFSLTILYKIWHSFVPWESVHSVTFSMGSFHLELQLLPHLPNLLYFLSCFYVFVLLLLLYTPHYLTVYLFQRWFFLYNIFVSQRIFLKIYCSSSLSAWDTRARYQKKKFCQLLMYNGVEQVILQLQGC